MSQAASSPVGGATHAGPSGHGIGAGLALALVGLVMAVAVVELALRVTAYHQTFAQADATIGYVLTPRFARVLPALEHDGGSVVLHTNNLGLRRDVDTTIRKPATTTRVLVLGDSQTEGIVSNEETYSTGLERALNEAQLKRRTGDGHRVEVLNAAVSGYSPLLEYLWLRERGRILQPDIILVALYAGNDIGELLMHYEDFGGFGPPFLLPFLEHTTREWEIVPPGYQSGTLGRIDWLLQTYLRSYAMARRALRPTVPNQKPTLLRLIKQSFGCLQALWQPYIAHGDVSALADGFAKLDYVLGQFQAEAGILGARLLVTVIPSKLEAEDIQNTPAVREAVKTLGLNYDPVAFDRALRERMVTLAEQHGIQTVDLLPALRRWHVDHHQRVYWDLDWHLNVEGHRVVAEDLLPIVSGLIEPEPGAHTE